MPNSPTSRIREARNFIRWFNSKYRMPAGYNGLWATPNISTSQRRMNVSKQLRGLITMRKLIRQKAAKIRAAKAHTRARAPKRNLTQAVFSPKHVAAMTARYGNNWLNKV